MRKDISVEKIKQLQAGSLFLYVWHGLTDTSKPDRVPRVYVYINDCSTQRLLTEAGRAVAAEVGEAIRQAAIPIEETVRLRTGNLKTSHAKICSPASITSARFMKFSE